MKFPSSEEMLAEMKATGRTARGTEIKPLAANPTRDHEEKYRWEAWVGQKIVKCESFPDGRTYVELEDGRGCIFGKPEAYLARTGIHPLDVAEITL